MHVGTICSPQLNFNLNFDNQWSVYKFEGDLIFSGESLELFIHIFIHLFIYLLTNILLTILTKQSP